VELAAEVRRDVDRPRELREHRALQLILSSHAARCRTA
jgi:hypothetical protein